MPFMEYPFSGHVGLFFIRLAQSFLDGGGGGGGVVVRFLWSNRDGFCKNSISFVACIVVENEEDIDDGV